MYITVHKFSRFSFFINNYSYVKTLVNNLYVKYVDKISRKSSKALAENLK